MFKGFRDFLVRGDVIDLAVGVVMGLAFNAVIQSAVKNIINPLIGKIFGQPDFSKIHPGRIPLGTFLNDLVSFIFVAIGIYFIFVLPMNKYREWRSRHETAPSQTDPEEIALLREIRDALVSRPPIPAGRQSGD
jgi:large conductance mechanosensitive channel